MKKITPAIATIALTGILASCGSPAAVNPTPPAPSAPKAGVESNAATVVKVTTPPVTPPPATETKPADVATEATASGIIVTESGDITTVTVPTAVPVSGTGTPEAGMPMAVPPITSTNTVTKVVTYTSPAGPEEIEVTLGITDNVIASVSVKPMATHEISKKKQTGFAAEVGVAVGKPTALFNLDTVAGASLTTKAFNAYVQSL